MTTQPRKRVIRTGAAKRRRSTAARGSRSGAGNLGNFFVPLVFIVAILFCIGFLSFMGYRTVTASSFFDVKTIDVRGTTRLQRDDIAKIVSRDAEKSGVWKADLARIKADVEKLTLVKSAVVSRVLPDGLRVNISERVPRAVVHLNSGDFWADDDAVILGAVGKSEERPPFNLTGWDESKTEKAMKDNQERVKIYAKMLEDWQNFDLAKRVSTVDMKDLQEPQAFVQDSGEQVAIILPRENFGKRLQTGLERIAGKGKNVKSIDLSNQKEVLRFRVN
ncbi:MAG: FtsQ-type POTRA domain-containing protein [Acidobacteria bacterium]|nr:FtsQ-type POTRA domain-containing protein [Acidobacteriota bacterium]